MPINYSIIIPHKNIPQLLQRCLDSIPVRDDLEVIVVDDNSDVSLVDFSRFPGKNRNDTVFFFDKKGRGAGGTRNIGLQHARGKWILFADSDDYFNYCLNEVLDDYVNDESDLVFFANSSVNSDTYVNSARSDAHVQFIVDYFDGDETSLQLLKYVHAAPHGKLIKRNLIEEHGISFPEIQMNEDMKFSYLTSYYAKSVKVDRRAIYCLTYRSTSISYTLTEQKWLDHFRAYAERELFLKAHNVVLPNQYFRPYLNDLIYIISSTTSETYEKCLDIFAEYGISRKEIDIEVHKKIKKRDFLAKVKAKISLGIQKCKFFCEK